MGEVARTLVSLSGPDSVHGVIPEPLVKYERSDIPSTTPSHAFTKAADGRLLPAYEMYGKTTVVKDMHTRKQMMAQEVLAGGPGSGFIALSGGYGTLEELMEVVTWNQLGIHNRGVVLYNVEGYWDGLLTWINGSVEAGFVGEGNKSIVKEARDAEGCVKELREYKVATGRFKLSWGNE
jgi:predicted Rossmann-fold nucleotide-binding protein